MKEKTAMFKKCNIFGQACFLHPRNQVFAYHAYIFDILSYLNVNMFWSFMHESCIIGSRIIGSCIVNYIAQPIVSDVSVLFLSAFDIISMFYLGFFLWVSAFSFKLIW